MSVQYWQRKFYQDKVLHDPVERFLHTLERYIEPRALILEVGAGAGSQNPYSLNAKGAKVIGIDLDPRIEKNPLLDHGILARGESLPFSDSVFDLAFCIYVLEHISDPRPLVSELRRVLKPNGHFLALTPSRYHYVSLIAACTPTWFHKWLNEKRGRPSEDTFPTHYKLNSLSQIRGNFIRAGFRLMEFDSFEVQPNYLKFSVASFLAGVLYEKVVNSLEMLSGLRVNFICALKNVKSICTKEITVSRPDGASCSLG